MDPRHIRILALRDGSSVHEHVHVLLHGQRCGADAGPEALLDALPF